MTLDSRVYAAHRTMHQLRLSVKCNSKSLFLFSFSFIKTTVLHISIAADVIAVANFLEITEFSLISSSPMILNTNKLQINSPREIL